MKTVKYMLNPGSNTSHRVIGVLEGQHAQIVQDDYEAWHAEVLNLTHLAIELAQPTIDDPFSNWQYEEAARVVRGWMEKYRTISSIVGHEQAEQGKRWGKTDPGPMFDWDRFLALL